MLSVKGANLGSLWEQTPAMLNRSNANETFSDQTCVARISRHNINKLPVPFQHDVLFQFIRLNSLRIHTIRYRVRDCTVESINLGDIHEDKCAIETGSQRSRALEDRIKIKVDQDGIRPAIAHSDETANLQHRHADNRHDPQETTHVSTPMSSPVPRHYGPPETTCE
jgi:hypothetical protein